MYVDFKEKYTWLEFQPSRFFITWKFSTVMIQNTFCYFFLFTTIRTNLVDPCLTDIVHAVHTLVNIVLFLTKHRMKYTNFFNTGQTFCRLTGNDFKFGPIIFKNRFFFAHIFIVKVILLQCFCSKRQIQFRTWFQFSNITYI